MINIKMQPAEVQKLSPKITVIGVGGAGGNAVNNMISSNLEGCEFLVCNTDSQALGNSLSDNKVQLGITVTGGLGAGSKPDVGKAAAEESLSEISQYLDGANMVFITAGMGGGTGTGAAPVIAKACRELGILTVGVVTKPFHFEGAHRMRSAEAGIEEMQGYVDTLIVIPNQNLFRIANEKTTFAEAFRMADSVLQSGVRGVTDLMVRPGLVNLDFADIRTAMLEMGKAMMGTGEAQGDKRAIEAAESAINNPLLDDVSMKGAHGVIINVTGGLDMTLFEADEACNRIRDEVDPNANIIFGATFDESLEGTMRVSIVATGIEKESMRKGGSDSGSMQVTEKSASVTLERAQPNTTSTTQGSSLPVMPPLAASQEMNSGSEAKSVDERLAGQSKSVIAESEADVFEQQRYSVTDETQATMPQNTAMRGTRYKNSFIPPMPMDPSSEVPVASTSAAPMSQVQTGSQLPAGGQNTSPAYSAMPSAQPSETGSRLELNPPKLPMADTHKKVPSLFERITGSVQKHLEDMIEEKPQVAKRRVVPSPSFHDPGVPAAPAQGRLNIESPVKTSDEKGEGDGNLDIPAFLRRQAN